MRSRLCSVALVRCGAPRLSPAARRPRGPVAPPPFVAARLCHPGPGRGLCRSGGGWSAPAPGAFRFVPRSPLCFGSAARPPPPLGSVPLGFRFAAPWRHCLGACGEVLPCAPPPRRPRWGLRGARGLRPGAPAPAASRPPLGVGLLPKPPPPLPHYPRRVKAKTSGPCGPALTRRKGILPGGLDIPCRACYYVLARPVPLLRGPPARVSMDGTSPVERPGFFYASAPASAAAKTRSRCPGCKPLHPHPVPPLLRRGDKPAFVN